MKILKYGVLFLVTTLLLVEGYLRVHAWLGPNYYPGEQNKGDNIQKEAMQTFLQEKIDRLWWRFLAEKASFYEPPFEVFINRGYEDAARMRHIAEHSRLPHDSQSTQQNFLRRNLTPDTGLFTVRGNNLGFRGEDRQAEKPAGTYRIIVLGSYPAFGHAVNDGETYPYVLEKELARRIGRRPKVEVWNGGRQGGTSIMGVARLQYEIGAYRPDLIIWDYGWIEMYLMNDVSEDPGFEKQRMIPLSAGVRKVYDFCHKAQFLYTCRQIINKYGKISAQDAITGWRTAMEYLREWSAQNSVPVIFLRHRGVSLPAEEFTAFDRPQNRFYYLDTHKALDEKLSPAETDEFWSGENWLSELGHTREDVLALNPDLMFVGDAIQYNKYAYRRFGRYLADFIWHERGPLRLGARK